MAESSQTPQQRIAAAARPTRLDTLIGRVAPGIASNRIKSRVDHELRMMLVDRTASYLRQVERKGGPRVLSAVGFSLT